MTVFCKIKYFQENLFGKQFLKENRVIQDKINLILLYSGRKDIRHMTQKQAITKLSTGLNKHK